MTTIGISDRARNFIFQHIDSVELLEVLLTFHANEKQSWTTQTMTSELRSNPQSIAKRFSFLKSLSLVREDQGAYSYAPPDQETRETIDDLAAAYHSHRHKIFELIFSPLKKARDFADAFRIGKFGEDGQDDK